MMNNLNCVYFRVKIIVAVLYTLRIWNMDSVAYTLGPALFHLPFYLIEWYAEQDEEHSFIYLYYLE